MLLLSLLVAVSRPVLSHLRDQITDSEGPQILILHSPESSSTALTSNTSSRFFAPDQLSALLGTLWVRLHTPFLLWQAQTPNPQP